MTGIALNLFTENIYITSIFSVGVKSKQSLPNLPDGRGHSQVGVYCTAVYCTVVLERTLTLE